MESSGRAAVKSLIKSHPGIWFSRDEIKAYVRANASAHTEGSLNTLIRLCVTNNARRPWPRSGWGDRSYGDMDYNLLHRRGADDAYRGYEPSDPPPIVP